MLTDTRKYKKRKGCQNIQSLKDNCLVSDGIYDEIFPQGLFKRSFLLANSESSSPRDLSTYFSLFPLEKAIAGQFNF